MKKILLFFSLISFFFVPFSISAPNSWHVKHNRLISCDGPNDVILIQNTSENGGDGRVDYITCSDLVNASTPNAVEVPISDVGNVIISGEVEGALQENRLLIDANTSKQGVTVEEQNVQADWNEADTGSDAYIDNKPSIIPEAPNDGNMYARMNEAWQQVVGGSFDASANYTVTGDWVFQGNTTLPADMVLPNDTVGANQLSSTTIVANTYTIAVGDQITFDQDGRVTGYTVAGADTTPDAFSFVDQTDVAVSTLITSASVTITGIDSASSVSITGGEWDKNSSGSWSSGAGSVVNNDTVQVRHTSSGSDSTDTDTVLTVGGVADTFTSTTAAGAAATETDDFNRTDELLAVSSDWSDVTVGDIASTVVAVNSNKISSSGSNTFAAAVYTGTTFSNDQYSQVLMPSTSGSSYWGVTVRMTTGGNGYLCQCVSATSCSIARVDAGARSILGSLITVSDWAGQTLKCSVTGTTVGLYLNDVLQEERTDATYASGDPGVMTRLTAVSYALDDFEGGDL